MRVLLGVALTLLLAACARAPTRPPVADAGPLPPTSAVADDPCAVLYEHRDEDYTPGGLYAPDRADHAPAGRPDPDAIPEPVPRAEPRAASGNRSPYTGLGRSYHVLESARGYRERGTASWYGAKFHGRLTSSREPYDMCSYSAAHKTLPLPSYVRVTNLDNGRSVVVRVNDRGPFHQGRIIDLSYIAAIKLGLDRTGTAPVEVVALTADGEPARAAPAPAASPRYSGDGRASIQVGSFADKDNARRVRQQLEDAGIDDVELEDVDVDDRRFWRVRIGPLRASRLDAVLQRVRALGFSAARVMSE